MSDAALHSERQTLLEKDGQELAQGIVHELDLLHREVARLRDEVATLRRQHAPNGAGSAPKSAVIEADEQLKPEQGFHPVEHAGDGQAFAWTGPSRQFSFDVHVDRSKGADLQLDAFNFLDFERQGNVRLSVDGQAVAVRIARESPGVVITAELPPRASGAPAHLAFELPEVMSPPNSTDARLLGLAFVRLTVTAHG